MTDPKPINMAPNSYFKKLGWRAVSRDEDGHAISSIAPGFPMDYREWAAEQDGFGYTVVELQQREG